MRHTATSVPVSVKEIAPSRQENAIIETPRVPRKRAQSPLRRKNGAKIKLRIPVARERSHHAPGAVARMELRLDCTADDGAYKAIHLALPFFRRFRTFEPRVKSVARNLRCSTFCSISHDVDEFSMERRQLRTDAVVKHARVLRVRSRQFSVESALVAVVATVAGIVVLDVRSQTLTRRNLTAYANLDTLD